jgi:hypothetical protein
MTNYHLLPAQRLAGAVRVACPALPKPVDLAAPALDVMTDLRHIPAAVIEPDMTMEFGQRLYGAARSTILAGIESG